MEKLLKLNELVKKADPGLIMKTSDKGGAIITEKEWITRDSIFEPFCTVIKVKYDYSDTEVTLTSVYSDIRVACSLDDENDTIRIIKTLFSPLTSITDEDLVYLLNNLTACRNRHLYIEGSKIIMTNKRKKDLILASLNRSTVDELIKRNRINDIFWLGTMSGRNDVTGMLTNKLFDIGLCESGKKSVRSIKIPVTINSNIKLLISRLTNDIVVVSIIIGKKLKRLSDVYLYNEEDMDDFVDIVSDLLIMTGTERVIEFINKLTPATAVIEDGRYIISLYDNYVSHSLYETKYILRDIATIVEYHRYSLIGSGYGILTYPSPESKNIQDIEVERIERQERLNTKK